MWSLDDWLRRRCGSGSSVTYCSGSDGGRSDRKFERSGTDSWCRENILDKPSEDGGLEYCGGRVGSVVGRSVGMCGVEGVSGRKCAASDCAQISSCEQVLGEMADRAEFIIAPEEAALEHHEFERVGDGESSKRQDFELERENGGKRDWCEAASLDGSGPVVVTLSGTELDTTGSTSAIRICLQQSESECFAGLDMWPERTVWRSVRKP